MKQRRMDNFANCMFFSNHDLPFQIEEKDRRYSVIKTEHKALKDVAKEKFNINIDSFIKKLKLERDSFLIEMKMLKLDNSSEELALSLLDNETKNKIKEQTNTIKDTLKEKILDRDTEYFENILGDVLDGIEHAKLKDKDLDKIVKNDYGDDTVVKSAIIFEHTNEQYKNFLIDEVQQGIFTNETLRWFTKIYEIESANSLHKFGKFWNLVVSKSEMFAINQGDKKIKSIKLRILDASAVGLSQVVVHGVFYSVKEGTNSVLVEDDEPF